MITDVDDLRELEKFLTPEERLELHTHLDAISLPQLNLIEFTKQAWSVIEPNTPYKHNWHIDVISEHLEAVVWGQIQNLVINIPPRYMKTTLISVCWQPWVWSFRPWSQWLFYSHSRGFSMRDNVRSRRVIQSQFYQEAFGHVVQLQPDQNTKTRVENVQGGVRSALGVGVSTGDGGDYLVGDDLLQIDHRHSETIREGVNEFWGTTVATRKNHDKTASVIVCQRLHEHDIVGYLEEQHDLGAPRYEILSIPAEYEPGRQKQTVLDWKDPRSEQNELLWGNRFGREQTDQLKRSLGDDAPALLQQRPSPAGGGIFKRYWWHLWLTEGVTLPPYRETGENGQPVELGTLVAPERYDKIILSWDCSFKDKKSSSFVVGQVWGCRGKADRFLLDQVRGQMTFTQTVDAIKALAQLWPLAREKLVEDKANGTAVIDTLKREISGLIPITPKGDKISRAHAVTPAIKSGNVFIPHPATAPWVAGFINETGGFPNAQFDDQVDAMTQALSYLEASGFWSR